MPRYQTVNVNGKPTRRRQLTKKELRERGAKIAKALKARAREEPQVSTSTKEGPPRKKGRPPKTNGAAEPAAARKPDIEGALIHLQRAYNYVVRLETSGHETDTAHEAARGARRCLLGLDDELG